MSEEEIQTAFVKAANIAIDEREELIANAKLMMDMVCDTTEQRAQSQKLLTELDILVEQIQKLVHDNARIAKDQIEYQRQYDELERRYNKAKDEYDEATAEVAELQKREDYFKQFIATLEAADEIIEEFDEGMWCSMVESMTVHRKDNIVFTFVGGMEVVI